MKTYEIDTLFFVAACVVGLIAFAHGAQFRDYLKGVLVAFIVVRLIYYLTSRYGS